MIYFDNAATSLPKPSVVGEAMIKALNTFGGAGRSGHEPALNASRSICKARQSVSKLLGAEKESIIFTSGATESLNTVLAGCLNHKDHVITTTLEHNSVLRPLYRLSELGMELSVVPVNADGSLNYTYFEKFRKKNTKAVVCTHGSNVTGEILDLQFISQFCQKNGLLFIVDASQTAGSYPININKMGIDILCFTGHKGLMGPQGTGGICIREGIEISPLKVGGSGIDSYSRTQPIELPEHLEAGTPNAHGIAGLCAGIQYIQKQDIEQIYKKENSLTRKFLDGIEGVPNIRICGNHLLPHAPIVSLNVGNMDSAEVATILSEEYSICVRSGAHCAPLIHEALGTVKQGAVRFSFSFFNTEEEIEKGIVALKEIQQKYS